jgi:LPXTG-site transpeptidase (sortase) family protein
MNKNDSNQSSEDKQKEAAVNAIRNKLNIIYGEEPDAKEELQELEATRNEGLSKHQKYMDNLSKSGRSLEEIQTAWHEYYTNLPDKEKHEVWQEFYSKHAKIKQTGGEKKEKTEEQRPAKEVEHAPVPQPESTTRHEPIKSANQTKNELIGRVRAREKLKGKHHLQSLLFGFGMGLIVIVIFLFSFFNERFITPFIRPSYAITTPIIVDPNSKDKVSSAPKIIIPKINVEAPVVYDEPSIQEDDIQKALERGVVHYATTPEPGEKGNSVIVGHSSSNILNSGKYKFAFLLLKSLEQDDTFIVHKDSKRYVYKVYKKLVTSPDDTSVLGATAKPSTMTLITCDPPGLSTNRLIIVGEQIYPDPAKNKASSVDQGASQRPQILPSNSPSLWQRIQGWF